MNSAIGRIATMGLCGGAVAATAVAKPKTQRGEHNLNKFTTAVGLGSLAATPYIVKNVVKNHPVTSTRIAGKTGAVIEAGTEYAVKYGKKAANYVSKSYDKIACTETGGKAIKILQKAFSKVKNSVFGKKLTEKIASGLNKIKSNVTVQKAVTKAAEALKNFASSSTIKKGAIGLIAAGVALLAYGGFKIITNFYKKEGAIDQKYKDIEVMDKYLA